MKRKSRGQALVEFALIFPFIILLLFASIDFGYYIYAWSETQFAARRGGEQASKMQPREIRDAAYYQNALYYNTDPCFRLIVEEAARSGGLNEITRIKYDDVFISYHSDSVDATPDLGAGPSDKKMQGQGRIIQLRVKKSIPPLTPLVDWLLGGGNYEFNSISRRTIVANGPSFGSTGADGSDFKACTN